MSDRDTQTLTSPHLLRLMHWMLGVSMPLLLFTGLCIHGGSQPAWSFFNGYPTWLPTGRMQLWHLVVAVVFSACLLPAIVGYIRHWISAGSWGGFRVFHLLLLLGGLVMLGTGVVLSRWPGERTPYLLIRGAHLLGAITVGATLLLHILLGFTLYIRWLIPAFAPWRDARWRHLLWPILLLPVATLALLNDPWDLLESKPVLHAVRIDAAEPTLAGLPWDRTEAIEIPLANGVGYERGVTTVRLEAMHDGSELFVHAAWFDRTEDRQYTPWRRTPDGWEQLAAIPKDEYVHYEDKFSLIFPLEPSRRFDVFGCAYSCHLGGGMPFGYKETPFDTDVWHWKATRTDPVGQVDDKYWSLIAEGAKDYGRYGDPKTGGGYEKNTNAEKTRPTYLPVSFDRVRQGAMHRTNAVPWSAEAEQSLTPGTVIPGIVHAAFAGDRGHIRCESTHRNNHWHLYLTRPLDTESEYDVAFVPGREYAFGCAAFDHAAKRHAYNLRVYRLKLDP